jgi:hypothetical protein
MTARPRNRQRPHQFGVAALFELTAVCGAAAACSPIIGSVASGLLMAAALVLAARRGALALAAMLGAMLAADHGFEAAASSNPFLRQAVVALSFAAIVGWYRHRALTSALTLGEGEGASASR